jgi:hypothetical protein
MNIYARNVVAIVLLLPTGLISQNQDNKNLELGNFFISHYKRDFLRSSFTNKPITSRSLWTLQIYYKK